MILNVQRVPLFSCLSHLFIGRWTKSVHWYCGCCPNKIMPMFVHYSAVVFLSCVWVRFTSQIYSLILAQIKSLQYMYGFFLLLLECSLVLLETGTGRVELMCYHDRQCFTHKSSWLECFSLSLMYNEAGPFDKQDLTKGNDCELSNETLGQMSCVSHLCMLIG